MKLKILLALGVALLFTTALLALLRLPELFRLDTVNHDGVGQRQNKIETSAAKAVKTWINPETCDQRSTQADVPETIEHVKLIPATLDAIQGCNQRKGQTERRQQLREAQERKKEEDRAQQQRRARFEEVGQYSGNAHTWTLDQLPLEDTGIVLVVHEADVLRDRLLIPVQLMNHEKDGTRQMRLKFTLMLEDGSELLCQQVGGDEGRVQVGEEGSVIPPPPGEQASVVLAFVRKNASGRFALAVNGKAIFHITAYKWRLRPFGGTSAGER